MTVRVDRTDEGFDAEEPAVLVATTDATGTTREYRIRLTTDETFDDGRLLAGRRVDGDGFPTERAYGAARRAFEERGFDAHGGGDDV